MTGLSNWFLRLFFWPSPPLKKEVPHLVPFDPREWEAANEIVQTQMQLGNRDIAWMVALGIQKGKKWEEKHDD